MNYGQTLIDLAAQKGYTRYRLSQDLDVGQSHLSAIAKGGAISPVLAARIAARIGENAKEAALQAVAAQATEKEREQLLEAFDVQDWRKRSLSNLRKVARFFRLSRRKDSSTTSLPRE